jgi:hypothetical protein
MWSRLLWSAMNVLWLIAGETATLRFQRTSGTSVLGSMSKYRPFGVLFARSMASQTCGETRIADKRLDVQIAPSCAHRGWWLGRCKLFSPSNTESQLAVGR